MTASATQSVTVRAYLSPTLVLLAMDWSVGANYSDFLGFAILRAPGFLPGEKDGWLRNKIGFTAPQDGSQPLPSNLAPFQKFLWWDSAIQSADRGKQFTYTVTPVRGTGANDLHLETASATTIKVTVPTIVDANGIGTYFNRAVVSSQAFSAEFRDTKPDPKKFDQAMAWLANGLQDAIPSFLGTTHDIAGAIYHLTDEHWVIPALQSVRGTESLVYYWKPGKNGKGDTVNQYAAAALKGPHTTLDERTKTNIMHDKFLVRLSNGSADAVLTGSANFTPEGLTTQANLLHTIESPKLAALYKARQMLLTGDPTLGNTSKGAAWSNAIRVGKATVRVFFSPEPKGKRVSLDTIVAAIKKAKSSVAFCLFSPTDAPLLSALLAIGNPRSGKLLYGLLNSIHDPDKRNAAAIKSGVKPPKPSAATTIQVEVYNRSRKDKLVLPYSYFLAGSAPAGFLPELSAVDTSAYSIVPPPKPRKGSTKKNAHIPPAVHIHHKFIVIDADTDTPTIYTGSANLSNNSTHENDENLLEITGSPELGRLYFAEFMRLYEHYRARALWNMTHGQAKSGGKGTRASTSPSAHAGFVLQTTRDAWVRGAYKPGTPAYLARRKLSK